MLIKTLVENTSISKTLNCEHGLSLYLEIKKHKILFDVGASSLFNENAKKLNIDISEIDYLIISHGHYDHGGGLKTFLKENNKATVFIQDTAFNKHYGKGNNNNLKYIGLDKELENNHQIKIISDSFLIDEGILIFSNVENKSFRPINNRSLFMEHNDEIIMDDFSHEQNLIIEEDGTSLLITGCAHNGIVNIIEDFKNLKGHTPDYLIGGFHLNSRSEGIESISTINKISEYLLKYKTKYYTCHCTGIEGYKILKATMGDQIDYIGTGTIMKI